MRALTFHGRQDVRFESVADPAIQEPGDAIVRVQAAGICGSDLHVYHEREKGMDPGAVLGHEFVGVVIETGAGVGRFRRGQRVLSPFTTSCGECFYCVVGLTARCTRGELFGWVQDGRGLQGGQAEYVRVPLADSTLIAVPDAVTFEEAILLADVLSTGSYCADQVAIADDGTYVVVGCGPVGLMAVVGAREFGAQRLYAIDSIPERLALAERFGASTIDAGRFDAVAAIRRATGGRGADGVMEAVGSGAAMRLALDLVRPGGTLSVAGVHNEPQFAFSPTEAYDKNLTYRVGRCPARHYAERLLPLVERRVYDLTAVFSHRIPLSQGVEGYRLFDEKRDGCTKVLLIPDSGDLR